MTLALYFVYRGGYDLALRFFLLREKRLATWLSRGTAFCQEFSTEKILSNPQRICDAVDKRGRANTITANLNYRSELSRDRNFETKQRSSSDRYSGT
jgi:hypothetical protein